MTNPAYIILAKGVSTPQGEGIEIHLFGECPRQHLKPLAGVALEMGFDLMFEFNEPPNMEEVAKVAPEGKISGMESMVRLWKLGDGE